MTGPKPIVSGGLLRPVFDALGIPWQQVRETRILPPDLIEVTYALLGDKGEKYKAGNSIAQVTLRARVDWNDGREFVFGEGDVPVDVL